MDALANLTAYVFLILVGLWLLTFIPPTRRLFARLILAPRHVPLRKARKVLVGSALAAFIFGFLITPNRNTDIVPKGKWVIMSFSYKGSELEQDLALDETKREVMGPTDDDDEYDSRTECEKALHELQSMPSSVAMLTKYHPEASPLNLSEAAISDRRVMTAICEQSDGSAKFKIIPPSGGHDENGN